MIAIENPGAELAADLLAHVILLLVQRPLLEPGDVAAVLACHVALFLADLMVLLAELIGLLVRQVAFLDLMVDARGLAVQTVVHLLAARTRAAMAYRPLRCRLSWLRISGSDMPRIGSRLAHRRASPNAADS